MNRFALALLALPLTLSAPFAQDASSAPEPALALELNAVQPAETGCRVTFLATNDLGAAVDRAGIEMAFFTADGGIDRIVTLDFTGLTQGKTKVLQFELKDLLCDDIGRLLVNDVVSCEGEGLPADSCLKGLVTTARPPIQFGV
jgi:hypothetical protein